jgi:hypothetical protein
VEGRQQIVAKLSKTFLVALTRLETRPEKRQMVGTLLNIASTSRDGWNSRYTLIAGRDPLLQGEPAAAAAVKRTADSLEKVLGNFRYK